jgi:hypothetical protein
MEEPFPTSASQDEKTPPGPAPVLPDIPYECRLSIGKFFEFTLLVGGIVLVLMAMAPLSVRAVGWFGWFVYHFGFSVPGAFMVAIALHYLLGRARIQIDRNGVTEFGIFRSTFQSWADLHAFRSFLVVTEPNGRRWHGRRRPPREHWYLGLVSKSKLAEIEATNLPPAFSIDQGRDLGLTIAKHEMSVADAEILEPLLQRTWDENASPAGTDSLEASVNSGRIPGTGRGDELPDLLMLLLVSLGATSVWGVILGVVTYWLNFPYFLVAFVAAFWTLYALINRADMRMTGFLRGWAAFLLVLQHIEARWLIERLSQGEGSSWTDPAFLSSAAVFGAIGYAVTTFIGLPTPPSQGGTDTSIPG